MVSLDKVLDVNSVGPEEDSTLDQMKSAKRWLLSRDKRPFYIDGSPRGATDTDEDRARLATYDEATVALSARGAGWLLGFALGPDSCGGHWQGIDFDDLEAKGIGDLANQWGKYDTSLPGYVELSPSKKGIHVIGYGRAFTNLGSNGTGIEAYANGRFFTFTGDSIRDGVLTDLGDYIVQTLAPLHGAARASSASKGVHEVTVDPQAVTELRSALFHLRADEYDLWIRMGIALRELGEVGRGIWIEWSHTSEKWKPEDARRWDTFKPTDTGYQAVFSEAQRQGWVNPKSKAAQGGEAVDGKPAGGRQASSLVGRHLGDVSARAIDWYWKGWLPKGYITIVVGETGAGKSTVLADIAARVTTGAPWPGETTQRPPARVMWLGSEDSMEEMTVPRLMACGANRENVIEIQHAERNGERDTFSLQDDIEKVKEWLKYGRDAGLPFGLIVIDPVTSYLEGKKLRKVDIKDAGQLRNILEPWLRLAQEYKVAIVCVTHLAKDASRSLLHRVLGTQAFAATCRSLLAVVKRPAWLSEEAEPYARILLQVKTNLPEQPGGAWEFNTEKVLVAKDPESGAEINATRPEWVNLNSSLDEGSLVDGKGPKAGGGSTMGDRFGAWFPSYFSKLGKAELVMLPEGSFVSSSQVKGDAIEAGIISEKWWKEKSSEYIIRKNHGGDFLCRPKIYIDPPKGGRRPDNGDHIDAAQWIDPYKTQPKNS